MKKSVYDNLRRIGALFLLMAVLLAGCGKSVKKQIAEQLELGNKYLTEANYEQAIVAFNKVIELDPKQAIAYEKMADSYLGLDKKEEAVDILCQGVSIVTETEAGADWQAMKERAVTLCEELLRTYLGTDAEEAKRYYEQLMQLDEAEAAQYESELQQAFIKDEVRSKYEDSLKNAKEQIAGDAWETLSVDQISWKFELSQELKNEGIEDIVYDYGDGTYLQVTKSGYVYYGNMKDGKRNGDNCIWFNLRDNGDKYYFKGMWKDDYPNGEGEEGRITRNGSEEHITTGIWSNGLENGKMQMKFLSVSWNVNMTFEYSASYGMPEVIDHIERGGNWRCVVSYSTDEKDELVPYAYGYIDESEIPWGVDGWEWYKGGYICTAYDYQ